MLFAVIFGSGDSPTASTSLVGWYEWSGGNLETSFRGSDGPKAEQAMGDDAWKSPGWLASWEINGQFFTEGYASSSPFPDPSSGTRVNWTNGWGDHTYYILARDLPGSVKTYDSNTDQPDVTLPTQSLPDRSTAATNLNTELARPEYHTLRLELQHLLDPRCSPDPLSSTVVAPAILPDESASDYAQCLSTLGLQANPTVTLSDSQVDWATPAGDVVHTQPADGTSLAPGSAVTIYANPTTMPSPTQRETNLAGELQANDPGIAGQGQAMDVVQSCLDREDTATGNTDVTGDSGDVSFTNCSTMPIFITGHDAQSAGEHDAIALGVPNVTTDPNLTFSGAYGGVNPGWVQLSRDVTGKDQNWKYSFQPCNSGPPNSAAQCDEYPFLSSQQGGGGVTPGSCRRSSPSPRANPPTRSDPDRRPRRPAGRDRRRSDAPGERAPSGPAVKTSSRRLAPRGAKRRWWHSGSG